MKLAMTISSKYKTLLLAAFILTCFIISFFIIRGHPAIGDENNFHKTIKKISESDMTWDVLADKDTYDQATMIPTYSIFLAVLSKIADADSLAYLRFISLLFGLLCLCVFFAIQKKLGSQPEVSTLQFAFIPILYPLFFVLYTDVPSLCFILLAAYFLVGRRWLLCGLFAGLSVFIRQNNVLWLAFFLLMVYLGNKAHSEKVSWSKFFARTWTFAVAFILFGVFVLWNGGFVLSDRAKHPLSFHTGNICFALFTFFCVLLPLNVSQLPKVIHLLKRKKTLIFLALIFVGYGMLTFKNDHPYNSPLLKFYLHNNVLKHALSNTWTKALFFSLAAYSGLVLAATELREKRFYWMYPATFVFLAASWLIEPRYCLIPLTLFLLFRQKREAKIEIATAVYLVIFALVIFHRINHKLFFI